MNCSLNSEVQGPEEQINKTKYHNIYKIDHRGIVEIKNSLT